MKKIFIVFLTIFALLLAGTALAANKKTHVLNPQLRNPVKTQPLTDSTTMNPHKKATKNKQQNVLIFEGNKPQPSAPAFEDSDTLQRVEGEEISDIEGDGEVDDDKEGSEKIVLRARKNGPGVFHQSSCKFFPHKMKGVREFKSIEDAKKAGYKPCNICMKKKK